MLKRTISIVVLCFLMGCASTQIPLYLTDKKSFTRRFYAGYDQVSGAVRQVMSDMGWVMENESEPQVFEIDPQKVDIEEKTLLMTDVREKRRILFTRYERMNVFIYSRGEVSDIEVRYLAITDMTVMKRRSFGDQRSADRFFQQVQKNLELTGL